MIGIRIRYERHEQSVTIPELAAKAGVEEECLRAVEEGGNQTPSVSFLEKVAKGLDLPPDGFLDSSSLEDEELDTEWLALVETAMDSGVTKEAFRRFLEEQMRKRGGF
ncbi:helix-turn-helix domain-containing protein [Salibacterium aidingense]|uniref:helix-turn-helix domain-containing protein n=1 Tax=Salibacterium aidingense TaxID=384933 RepID=UPI0003FDC08C|nr:DNA-binding anti-repressor SinI [Salibacterium aidingense]